MPDIVLKYHKNLETPQKIKLAKFFIHFRNINISFRNTFQTTTGSFPTRIKQTTSLHNLQRKLNTIKSRRTKNMQISAIVINWKTQPTPIHEITIPRVRRLVAKKKKKRQSTTGFINHPPRMLFVVKLLLNVKIWNAQNRSSVSLFRSCCVAKTWLVRKTSRKSGRRLD